MGLYFPFKKYNHSNIAIMCQAPKKEKSADIILSGVTLGHEGLN